MRNALVILCVAVIGCKAKDTVESKRVDTLDFKSFTVAVPPGWNEVTDTRVLAAAAPGSHTIMLEHPQPGFAPSIYIQELSLDAAGQQWMQTATEELCRDQVQKVLADRTKSTPGFARTSDLAGFKGCDIEVIDPRSQQSGRQIAASNGKITYSFMCNRDKQGAPDIDATCMAMAKGIAIKP